MRERERKSKLFPYIFKLCNFQSLAARSRAIDLCRQFLSAWLLISVPKGNRARYLIDIYPMYTRRFTSAIEDVVAQTEDEISLYKIFSALICQKLCALEIETGRKQERRAK